jgi:hypothetical protein
MNPSFLQIFMTLRQALNRLASFLLLALTSDASKEVESVEFGMRMTQEMRDIPKSARVL